MSPTKGYNLFLHLNKDTPVPAHYWDKIPLGVAILTEPDQLSSLLKKIKIIKKDFLALSKDLERYYHFLEVDFKRNNSVEGLIHQLLTAYAINRAKDFTVKRKVSLETLACSSRSLLEIELIIKWLRQRQISETEWTLSNYNKFCSEAELGTKELMASMLKLQLSEAKTATDAESIKSDFDYHTTRLKHLELEFNSDLKRPKIISKTLGLEKRFNAYYDLLSKLPPPTPWSINLPNHPKEQN